MYLVLLLLCLPNSGLTSATIEDAVVSADGTIQMVDAHSASADGTIEMIDAHSAEAGFKSLVRRERHLMNLAVAVGVENSSFMKAFFKAISNRIDGMRNSELLTAARGVGAGEHEIDLTADAKDRRAAIIELISNHVTKADNDVSNSADSLLEERNEEA